MIREQKTILQEGLVDIMRNRFDEQLDNLQESMKEMGDKCLSSITDTIEALNSGNEKLATSVISRRRNIRNDEREIESICLRLLMQQQPVASDLRVISSSLKAVYDLERIGDVASDIAEIVLTEHISTAMDILNLNDMATAASSMVHDSIQALNNKDVELAQSVIDTDDIVDNAFNNAKQSLIDKFSKDSNVEYALNLLMIAKYFEKIGDHAVNIAQWAMYDATGKL